MITAEMIPALQGVIPSPLGSASADGIPNVTYISQAFYLDEDRIALSFQFMNKTWCNLQENPNITVILTHPENFTMWELRLQFEEKVSEGALFDTMEMEMAAVVSMFAHIVQFKLKAALICRVLSVKLLYNGE